MKFIIIRNLKAAKMTDVKIDVQVAPYEANHQIVKLFREEKIKSVYAKDCGYFFYGVPYISIIRPKYPTVMIVDRKILEERII